MANEVLGLGWACNDCLFLLANGETPERMSEAETAAWLAEIDRRSEGAEVTLGMMAEEHLDGCDADETGDQCECEQLGFSWSACDVCGSHLGGSRDAVTFWRAG